MDVRFTEAGSGELFAVASCNGQGSAARFAADAYRVIGGVLRERELGIVHERIFCSVGAAAAVRSARARALARHGLKKPERDALTYVEGARAAPGMESSGIIVRAVPKAALRTLRQADEPVGYGWQDGALSHVVLQQSVTPVGSESREAQLERVLDGAQAALASAGFGYEHVVRTWFYVSDVLDWYGAFNRVRNEKYRQLGLIGEAGASVLGAPASTAIGARNPRGAAVVLNMVAARSSAGRVHQLLSNPKQPEAGSYGAAFARAALVRGSGATHIQLSGTAAIGEAGQSLHAGDAEAQITATLERIAALLAPHSATLHDTAAATAFVKRPEDVPVFRRVARAFGLEQMPCVTTIADVCRAELLFELDAELIVKHAPLVTELS